LLSADGFVAAVLPEVANRQGLRIDRGRNSFDAIRLAAALTVILGHAFVLTGFGPAPVVLGFPIHSLAVAVFFATSGYLIAGSWEGNPRIVRFIQHRALRIFPALTAVVLITVFIVGPFFTTRDLATYFASSKTWAYLQTMTTLAQYELPGVFDGHPRLAVNGSLWSLGVELVCYTLVILVGFTPRRVRAIGYILLGLAAATVYFVSEADPRFEGVADAAPMIVFFVGGALLRITIPEHAFRTQTAAVIFGTWAIATTLWPGWTTLLAWLALPYCVITLGRTTTPVSKHLARIGDISYGTYLWGFLVQQVVIEILGPIPLYVTLGLVLVGSMAFGWFSWIIIERPALSFKSACTRAPLRSLEVAARRDSQGSIFTQINSRTETKLDLDRKTPEADIEAEVVVEPHATSTPTDRIARLVAATRADTRASIPIRLDDLRPAPFDGGGKCRPHPYEEARVIGNLGRPEDVSDEVRELSIRALRDRQIVKRSDPDALA
jgi:peptidoglycan/LPS O-acetylase OafA/YrhL